MKTTIIIPVNFLKKKCQIISLKFVKKNNIYPSGLKKNNFGYYHLSCLNESVRKCSSVAPIVLT